MAQQVLDPLVDSASTPPGERQEPPGPALLPGWRVISNALIRARGEEGYVDLAALNAGRGVALVCFLDPDEEASPEEARAALRDMLGEAGMAEHFPGELPVVALSLPRAAAAELPAAIDRAFAGLPRPSVAPAWVDWLAERLAAGRAPAGEAPRPRLVAPPRDETSPEKSKSEITLAGPVRSEALPEKTADAALEIETPVRAARPRASLLDWGASLGFAFGIVLAMLILLALMSHTGRLF